MEQEFEEQAVPEITCQEVAEWTSAYLDQHMDEPSKVRIVLHLALCAGCEAYVKQIAAIRNMVGPLPGPPEPDQAQRIRLRQAFVTHQNRSSSSTSD